MSKFLDNRHAFWALMVAVMVAIGLAISLLFIVGQSAKIATLERSLESSRGQLNEFKVLSEDLKEDVKILEASDESNAQALFRLQHDSAYNGCVMYKGGVGVGGGLGHDTAAALATAICDQERNSMYIEEFLELYTPSY